MKMSMRKGLLGVMVGVLSLFMLVGCGSNNTDTTADNAVQNDTPNEATASVDSTEGTHYSMRLDETITEDDWFPNGMFFKSMISIVWLQTGEIWTLDLDVTDGNQYTLTSEINNSDEGVIDGDASFHHAKTIATGTCTVDGDTVTIETPDYVEYELGYGEFLEPYIEAWSYNSGAGMYAGEWNSDENPALLELVPKTTFKVDGDSIVSYESEGVEAPSDENQAADENTDTEAVDLGESLFQQVSDGGATYLDFYNNHVYVFSFPAQEITENGSYEYDAETGVLTLTTPNGQVFTSAEGDDIYTCVFKSDLNEALGGTFQINMSDFKAAVQ